MLTCTDTIHVLFYLFFVVLFIILFAEYFPHLNRLIRYIKLRIYTTQPGPGPKAFTAAPPQHAPALGRATCWRRGSTPIDRFSRPGRTGRPIAAGFGATGHIIWIARRA